ncbi:MAG: hypothetical protein BroJett040_05970 [Oligoflexia bacterium]|nr:MAG: hypothetical protein BroJett040_05970 [Oligoflexia bacterium]
MKLDRFLLLFSFFALGLQVIILLSDLGVVQISFVNSSIDRKQSVSVGQVIQIHNELRQKSSSEINWEDVSRGQDIYLYDSLLTLSKSTAQLKLKNGSDISLSEKTLVFIEPFDQDKQSQKLKLKFQEGSVVAKTGTVKTDIEAKSFVLTVEPESEVNIKKMNSQQFDVVVSKGSVDLKYENNSKNIQQGELIRIDADKGFSVKNISQSLKWDFAGQKIRKYATDFPIPIRLGWVGDAQELELFQAGQKVKLLPVEGRQEVELELNEGEFEARIAGANEVSSWLKVEIRRTPFLYLAFPLSRNRYQIDERVTYSWRKSPEIKSCEIEIRPIENGQVDIKIGQADSSRGITSEKTSDTHLEYSFTNSGKYLWTLRPYDDEGYAIPFDDGNPIYFSQELLEPPSMSTPEIRAPAVQEQRQQSDRNERDIPQDDQSPADQRREDQKEKNKKQKNQQQYNQKRDDQRQDDQKQGKQNVNEQSSRQGVGSKFFGMAISDQVHAVQVRKLDFVVQVLMNVSHAKKTANSNKQRNGVNDKLEFNPAEDDLEFNWSEVRGAEFYILEISEEPDFKKLLVEQKTTSSHFLWSHIQLKRDHFYWRVAGGSAQKMGRFSEPSKVSLADIQNNSSIKIRHGGSSDKKITKKKQSQKNVKILIDMGNEVGPSAAGETEIGKSHSSSEDGKQISQAVGVIAQQDSEVNASPEASVILAENKDQNRRTEDKDKDNKALNSEKSSQQSDLQNDQEKNQQNSEIKSERFRSEVSFIPKYEVNQYQEASIKYNFSGLVWGLQYKFSKMINEEEIYTCGLSYESVNWKSQSDFIDPASAKLAETRYSGHCIKLFNSKWILGARINQSPYIEKYSYESIRFENDTQFGIGIGSRLSFMDIYLNYLKGSKLSISELRLQKRQVVYQTIFVASELIYSNIQMPAGISGLRYSIVIGLGLSW